MTLAAGAEGPRSSTGIPPASEPGAPVSQKPLAEREASGRTAAEGSALRFRAGKQREGIEAAA